MTNQFHTIEIDRVVTGSNLYTAIYFKVRGGKIDLFSTHHTQINYVDTRIAQSRHSGRHEFGTTQPNITADHHLARLKKLSIGTSNPISDIIIELNTQLPANIIGFKAG